MCRPASSFRLPRRSNLIVPIGEWVLRTACAEAARWPEHLKIAVNISPAQFKARNLADVVLGSLAAAGIAAAAAGARDHRVGHAGGRGRRVRDADAAARPRRAHRARRFRHRLLLAEQPAQVPVRQDQDRPQLRQRPVRLPTSTRWRSCARSPSSASASAWRRLPKAWRRGSSSTPCARKAARRCRATTSARRARPRRSSG